MPGYPCIPISLPSFKYPKKLILYLQVPPLMAAQICLFFLFVAAFCAEAKYMLYNTSNGIISGKLNVHLVAHTHDDVGWLKTVDQYYVGSNNSIQGACVQNILDSLIPALLADKSRRFVYVEQAFFQRWWRDQSEEMHNTVKQLVSSGQLEFINGGMCMHDEAAPHYIDMIDQTTLGHKYIKEQFNVTPRIGWQIDPFGHSAVQAYLLGAEVGFDSFFFGRINYQDRIKRKAEKSLEVVWQGSSTLGSSAQIFAGAFPVAYWAPDGFSFELNDDSPVVQDDINLFDYNVVERVNDFVDLAVSQANVTRTDHIMMTMGADFNYQYALSWFRNLDKLIHYVNKDGRVNALYSTPSMYTYAKHAENFAWPLKTEDFFPYADDASSYWTGYFTSRPALKGYVRMMSSYYMASRQLEFFRGRSKTGPTTDSLGDALALAQHHDAVSGTSKQHVADDYAKRLSLGYEEDNLSNSLRIASVMYCLAEKLVADSLACIVESGSKSECSSPDTKFEQCPLLNISYCPASEIDLSSGKKLVVVVYNSMGWKRDDVVRIPVISEDASVHDSSGKEIVSQILPISNASLGLRSFLVTAYTGRNPPKTIPKVWLAFTASVPPLGFSTYVITTAKKTVGSFSPHTGQSDTVEVGQGDLKLVYSANTGKLMEYVNKKSFVQASVEQSFSYYSGYDGSQHIENSQSSGAYIFRPNDTVQITPEEKVPFTVVRGPLLDEVHQSFNSWISQITRVYKQKEHVEVEFTIGPIPIDDGIGKEIITQVTTAIKSNKTFYTDSGGRDFLERIRDFRADWELEVTQPIAGNYYPVNLGMHLKDDSKELSILVDRSVGGSSIVDGQLELMLHRRLLHDDDRGVGEALNETICVHDKCMGLTIQGKYYLRIDPLGEGAKWRRTFGQEIYSPFLLAFTEQEEGNWTKFQNPVFMAMDPFYNLPENIAIITLQELEDGKVLVRLAHIYEIGEDKDLSVMSIVDLKKLFPYKKIKEVTELSLSANQEREEMLKKRLVWKVEGSRKETMSLRGGPLDPMKLVVEIAPMEIRTFNIDFDLQ